MPELKHFDTLQDVLDWALQEMIYSAQDDDELDPSKLDDLLTLQAANPVVYNTARAEPEQAELDAFIERAGYHYGWANLDSHGRRMAEHAVRELKGTK